MVDEQTIKDAIKSIVEHDEAKAVEITKKYIEAGNNPMETTLVAWITETLQDAGIPNNIELVHPGERFDSTRHTATSRGVEITAVRGWIVVRDNGRVYTKALVDVT